MRDFLPDLPGADNPAATSSTAIIAPPQGLDLYMEPLLRPFCEQSAPLRSIVAIGCHPFPGTAGDDFPGAPIRPREAVWLRLTVKDGRPVGMEREPIRTVGNGSGGERPETLAGLARRARELSGAMGGDDLLLLRADLLDEMMTPPADDFSFRAVAVLLPQASGQPGTGGAWQLRRALFDRGLICIGGVHVAGCRALCFLASDAVRSLRRREVESRGHITISTLGEGGRFANQLFRYAYVKLYALRHGLTAAFPAWEGEQLFGLDEESCAGLTFPRLIFNGFTDDDRQLWERSDPPIDVDLAGFFQEIPACWRSHRPLLRRLFQLPPGHLQAIDAWRRDVTDGGRRTLVAIHVRRGDYRELQVENNTPWFRLVPTEWYRAWLRAIWPTLRDPLLYVATDEPEVIRPLFREFEMVSATFGSTAQALPDHVRDFEILRRADYLAVCNSSFSRMAAILAPENQNCFLASFETRDFVPYEPWMDPAFWARFKDSRRDIPLRRAGPVASSENALEASAGATIWLDVSDLLRYLRDHATLSGIQRVQCEILRNLPGVSCPQPICLVVLNKRGGLSAIEGTALLQVIEDIRSDTSCRADIVSELGALLGHAVPVTPRPRDIFLAIGAFWTVPGMGLLLQELKNTGLIIGILIHDIIPIVAPEYFEARNTRMFVRSVGEALTFADFVLTTSEYNKTSLIEHMAARKPAPLPVHLVPLAYELLHVAPLESKISRVVADIIATDYVLCVGTLEVRKNPAYLFNIWKMLVRSGRPNIPHLVLAGRQGWLVQDFMDQLAACNYLGGRIIVLHRATDVELDWLYRKCLLTMFPSFVEGWGLPVGESLAHGKICLCSALGGVPEVGGALADYIDPYNASSGFEQLVRYLDDPQLRRDREREIADRFKPRLWQEVADDLLMAAQGLARLAGPGEGVAAIMLPPGRYLPICSDAAVMLTEGRDGELSAELACVSGWQPAEESGVRVSGPTAMIRFRADAPVGTRINLVLRLAAYGDDFRIRLHSGSGAETVTCLTAGRESVAVLACAVEPENLVSARFSVLDAMDDGHEDSGAPFWSFRGILYFEPGRLAEKTLQGGPGVRPSATSPPLLPARQQRDRSESESPPGRILLRAVAMDDSRRAASFGAFLQTTDCYWPSDVTADRDAPIFADQSDRRAFYSGCGNRAHVPRVGSAHDGIRLIRRRDQFVSMARFSEGAVFDRSGVWRAFGYLHTAPPGRAPWLSAGADGAWVEEASLDAAPCCEGSHLIFYNGNLHNYYHWLVEGLLSFDILSRAMGPDANLKIALPKSMDINALFDHRESLRAVGLDGRNVTEIAADLIKVREAIWVDSDLVQTMPAGYLKDFQQRISARYANLRTSRNRRLLIARKGPTRKIHNLEQVQAVLSRYDFETVYLEGMSIADQILLFQSAEFIIGPHGAGLANLLFCEPGTKVIELLPSVEMRPFFWLISEKLDLVHGMQFCATTDGPGFQASIIVDIGKLQALIRMVDAHL
ncbi:MAG TPA: glycosyltransferase 61 family protein [Xanthobacteraceae bacterium]